MILERKRQIVKTLCREKQQDLDTALMFRSREDQVEGNNQAMGLNDRKDGGVAHND